MPFGFFKKENRDKNDNIDVSYDRDGWFSWVTGSSTHGTVTKKEALSIPAVLASINFIANIVAMLPINLYETKRSENTENTDQNNNKENSIETVQVKSDSRTKLLNLDTGDTLDSVQFWRSLVFDYFLGKGGYAYINRDNGDIKSLHYVDESIISMEEGIDPIFKDFDLFVNGNRYKPFEFIKLLRNTKNGASGNNIMNESGLFLSLMYKALKLEEKLLKADGKRKGILKPKNPLSDNAFERFKAGWREAEKKADSVYFLSDNAEYQELTASLAEMQISESRERNAAEIYSIFNIPPSLFSKTTSGNEKQQVFMAAVKTAVVPVLHAIETALNRDLLTESEKQRGLYFAFDTKDVLKYSPEERAKFYETGLKNKYFSVNEIRKMENLPPFNKNLMYLQLGDVVYDLDTETIYTANTDTKTDLNTNNPEQQGDDEQQDDEQDDDDQEEDEH